MIVFDGDPNHMLSLPVCERCGDPVREQRCDPIDITEPWDRMRTQVPGPTYNVPCGCIIRPGTEARLRRGRLTITDGGQIIPGLDRTPSGEHTSADTDDVVADIDAAIEDWEESPDTARWSADGSHEHDPPHWTRMDHGNGAMSGQADWGCDDVAERMRSQVWREPDTPLSPFTWTFADEETATREVPSTRAMYWAPGEPARRDLAERLAHAIITIDRWRRRIRR